MPDTVYVLHCFKWCSWKYFTTLSANENMALRQKTANRRNGVEEHHKTSRLNMCTRVSPKGREKAASVT